MCFSPIRNGPQKKMPPTQSRDHPVKNWLVFICFFFKKLGAFFGTSNRKGPRNTFGDCFRDLGSESPETWLLGLSGPLNRLNAILSLLQPLDRYRAPSAIESAIGRPYLALSRIHAQVGVLKHLVLNCLRGSTAQSWLHSV